MEDTLRRMAKVLGATGLEGLGHDGRFVVEGQDGSRMKVSVESTQQRFLAELKDPKGVVRASIDLAPVTKVLEDDRFPGRVTLHAGAFAVHVDASPNLNIEVVSLPN